VSPARSFVISAAAAIATFCGGALAQEDGSGDSGDESSAARDELPAPSEPWLAEPGNWAVDFNAAQVACYNGSMRACDSIWLSKRVFSRTFLDQYGHTCGGRVENRARDRCVEIFPGHD